MNDLSPEIIRPVPDEERVRVLQSDRYPASAQEAAFADIYNDHFYRLETLAGSRTADHASSEDLAQQALINAWLSIDRYDPRVASVGTWLYRITSNVVHNHNRTLSRRVEPSPLQLHEDHLEDGEHAAFDYAWYASLLEVLTQLGDPHGPVLEMDLAGHTVEEIAQAFNVSHGAAKVRMHRARKAAQKLLAEEVGLEDVLG